MMRTHNLLAFLSLTTALLGALPAQAAFEFIAPAKAPAAPAKAAAPVAPTAVAKPLPAPVKAPAMVPVKKLALPEEEAAKPLPLTPVWTAKAPVETAPKAIPLTPVVSSDDSSLQVLDGPLLPGISDEPMKPMAASAPIAVEPMPIAPAPIRQVLAKSEKDNAIMWDKPAAKISGLGDMTTSKDDVVPAPKKFEPVVTKKHEAPAPIVETILETPQPAVAVAPADDKVIEGFGSGMPLAIALRQIVPPQYRYSFGPGVDAGQRVSWQGGKPWSQVVSDMANKQGLQAEIAGNVVAIRRGGAVATTTGGASAYSTSMMEDVVLGGPSLIPPAPAKPAARTVISTTTETQSTAFKPLPMMDAPKAPKEEAPVSLLANAANDQPMPIIDRPIAVEKADKSFSDPTAPPPALPKALPPIAEETTIDAKPTALPLPEMAMDAPTVAPVKKAEAKTTADLTGAQEWTATSGKTLRSILQDWSKQANVSLVWSSDFDYPLQTDIRIQGTYPEAVRTLLAGFGKAQPKPIGRLHKNNNMGAQPVLIIETPRLING